MKTIVLFAGAGGSALGARMAGCEVAWAANHWPEAVRVHAENHPDTVHACQDLHQCDWTQVPAHDLLLASPSCQGHSRARGKDRPHHDAQRSTAWAVVSAAEVHRPEAMIVENVPEFLSWTLYEAWAIALQKLGYALSPHIVDAANHGIPQHRKRVFVVATRSRAPITLKLPRRPHATAETFVDFSAGRWSQIDKPGRSPATLARIAAGRKVHGDRFLIAYYGNEKGGRSLTRPVGTITTRDRWAIIARDRMRMFSVRENQMAMGFPNDYILPANAKDATMMLGNAVVPRVQADVIQALREAA